MPLTGTRLPVAGTSLEATDVEATDVGAAEVEATEREASVSLTTAPRHPEVDRTAGSRAAAMRAVRNIE
jgi:hypothetical protein